jgi:cysteine desulfurase
MKDAAVYLDHQGTTPLDPLVLEAMLPWISRPANPHASHAHGRLAAEAVEEARYHVAAAVNARPEEIVFTASATEAANLAIRSILPRGGRAVSSPIEHPCVRETLAAPYLNAQVVFVPVGEDGVVEIDAVEEAVDNRPDLVAVMAVNNEIGTIQPVEEIGRLCEFAGIPFLCDVVQAVGRVPIDVQAQGISLAPLSSHKLYGPAGIGALVARVGMRDLLVPLTTGGGQEGGKRPGTLPTALCVGFGRACELAVAARERDWNHASRLSSAFLAGLREGLGEVLVNGSIDQRIPHNLNIALPGIDADALLAAAPLLSIATGSACSSGALKRSHVLTAIGIDAERADGSIRIGFGRDTTDEDVRYAVAMVTDAAFRVTGKQDRLLAGGGLK